MDEVGFNIPLTKISFDASVSGVFAQVKCIQEFENRNQVSVEAIYVFPLPENASVAGCEMVIGAKTITAELKERGQAKQEYRNAVDAGHHASLLEQKRPNIFTISVGGVEPGENVKVVTTYNQCVPWQNNGGRFTIPLVVAPRFIPGQPSGTKTGGGWAEDTTEVPDASQITPVVSREGVTYTADIRVTLSPGFKCHISSPSHEMVGGVAKSSERGERFDIIDLNLDEPAEPIEIEVKNLTPDRDFVLCYRTLSAATEVSIHKGSFDGEEYVTVSIVPPEIASPKLKDVIFCLDISGSMSEPKLAGLKIVAEKTAERLRRQDPRNRIGIVAFESEVHSIRSLSKISDQTYEAIRGLRSMGGTYAGKALDHCFQIQSVDRATERYILFISDGQTADRWSAVVPGVRVVAVGIDVAVNMDYLKEIARETKGVSLAIYPGEDYDEIASTLAGFLAGPVLQDVEVAVDGRIVEDVLGTSDVYASMPASLAMKLFSLPSNIQLVGTDSQGKESVTVIEMQNAIECAFAHQIWAREKLRDRSLKPSELVTISLKHGVLCSQTAFVAVSIKAIPGEKPVKIEIPVALPHTWDYDKVFGEVYTGSVHAVYGALATGQSVADSLVDSYALRSGQFSTGALSRRRLNTSASKSAPSSSSTSGYVPPGVYPEPPTAENDSTSASVDNAVVISAVNVVDSLENLVVCLEQGSVEWSDAEARWASLKQQLSRKYVKNWTALCKVKTFYYLLKLRTFGFKVPRAILTEVSKELNALDTEAHGWWEKAQQLLGVVVS